MVPVRGGQVEDLGLPRGLICGIQTASRVVLPDRGGARMSAGAAMVMNRYTDSLEGGLVLINLRRAY